MPLHWHHEAGTLVVIASDCLFNGMVKGPPPSLLDDPLRASSAMTVLLEDDNDGFVRFASPEQIILAKEPTDVPKALCAMECALGDKRHLAGWFAYELGYALEPKLGPSYWKRKGLPLLCFGVFAPPERLSRAATATFHRAYAGPLRHRWTKEAYLARFEKAKDYIAAGDVYQVNLSFRSDFAFVGSPMALFLALRDCAEARHCAYVDAASYQILSLSPELFFEISRTGKIVARPMKGTAPRFDDPLTDGRARRELAMSEKNRAENLMIVDLLRNDLGRVAVTGSVRTADLFAVESYPTLHTMVSTIRAQLRPKTSLATLLGALFPCGSVTGAPKIRAMEIIRELESDPRGPYCGAIGHFAPDGSARFNVAIRTIAIENGRGTLGVGGGIVQDSTGEDEYAECLLKARFFADGRRPLGLIETLRWDNGFIRLDRHLARIARSAEALSLPFDKDAALTALYAAVRDREAPQRVRLTLDEAGCFGCTSEPLETPPKHWTFAISPRPVDSHDVLLRHKTTWREIFDDERTRVARLHGVDDVLFQNERGELTESSRANLFVRRGEQLLTPPLTSGLLDGVLRRTLLEEGQCRESVLTRVDLEAADEIFLGNSLRGLIPARWQR